MMNVTIFDNGAAFLLRVNGLTVAHFRSLGEAWKHIVWMYRVETQSFTVGKKNIPVEEWIDKMMEIGYLEEV